MPHRNYATKRKYDVYRHFDGADSKIKGEQRQWPFEPPWYQKMFMSSWIFAGRSMSQTRPLSLFTLPATTETVTRNPAPHMMLYLCPKLSYTRVITSPIRSTTTWHWLSWTLPLSTVKRCYPCVCQVKEIMGTTANHGPSVHWSDGDSPGKVNLHR